MLRQLLNDVTTDKRCYVTGSSLLLVVPTYLLNILACDVGLTVSARSNVLLCNAELPVSYHGVICTDVLINCCSALCRVTSLCCNGFICVWTASCYEFTTPDFSMR